MASTLKTFSLSPPHFSCFERRAHSRFLIRCLSSKDSTAALSLDSVKVSGAVSGVSSSSVVGEKREKEGDLGDGHVSSVHEGKKREKGSEKVKLEALWDDGYGTETVKDYLDYARDIIRPDGGPVRWFTPISCGPHLKGSPLKIEIMRMAARFGATIVPFGVIGEDDLPEFVLDYNDMMKIPYLKDLVRGINEKAQEFNIRSGLSGEVANLDVYLPGILPKIPGRLYYLFGKPIETKGKKEMLKDRKKARELYLEIKSEVESSMSYLLKKREQDPYRSIVDRTVYRAFRAHMDEVPTFEP